MTSVPSEREMPLITTVDHSAEFLKGPVLNWLINQNSDISGQASWVHTDSDSSQLIDSIVSLQAAASLTSSLFSLLATVFYRYSYQSEFELHFAHGLDQKQSDISKAIQFSRIQFRDHTLANNAEVSTIISNVLSSINAESLEPDASFESAYSIIELERPSPAELKKLHQAFEYYQGVIWLVIEQQDSGYQLKWLCSGKISVDVVQALQTHMLNLIGSVHRKPAMPLSKHTILSDQEIQQQLDFSKGKIIQDQKQPLFKIIENHAHACADKVAVIYQQTQLTYQQLNQQANYLAHALLAKNIAPGDGVAVHINPSENILVAILAIHKIGAIYIPIDPSFPTARVSTILEEVNPLVILCDSLTSDIPEQFSVICADIEELKKSAISDTNPEITVPTESISHIYFTSGTTGKPKGVMATHKNLIHYISAALNRYGFNQDDCFIAAAKFTFSISMFELMNPLVAGGCVRVIAREQVLDLKQLCQAVAASTVFHFGPSLLKQLLPFIEDNYSSFESFDKLRHVSSGGDMVPPEILEKLKKIFSNAEVFVIYGSSEISCMGCTFEVSRDQTITRTRVGSPHQNMTVRIFDNDGNMVPIGVAGQLYFSGGGLVYGYLNLPELTDEKFKIIDGQRFYAIGDVGRLDSDGNIELLGREDFQIQLRGIRIELAEIDGYLRKIPELKDAVASAQNLGGSEEKSIVAYVVSKTSAPLSVNEMKKYLLKYVPDYMIPAAFVQLDALPLNHNMKLDRKALPAPTKQNLLSSQVKSIGTTDTINKLVDIINQVCSTGVTSDDAVLDFYALGIESIALMQIRLLINKQLERELPLKILQQEHTSIEALANYLDSDASLSEQVVDAPIEKIQIVPRDQSIIASFSQQRLWFLDRLLGASGLYNIPWTIRLNGKLNVAALQQSFVAIIERQESLRTCFSEQDGKPLQVIKKTMSFDCELIDLSTISKDIQKSESQRILDTEANKAFDLKQVPLMRAVLLKLSEQEHILLVTIHHIVSDGWSMDVFKQELASFYSAISQGQSAILPELPIQYADYAVWQSEWLQDETLDKQLSYWKTQLADTTVLELPTDYLRPEQLSYQGGQETLTLSKGLTRSLRDVSQEHSVSLFMTLLAAFQVLLHRYSGQEDIIVGSPIAGRNHEEVEHLVGFFINNLVLRSDLSGNPGFNELLNRVRKTCVDAYAHQDVPFEKLVAELNPHRGVDENPFFNVLVNQNKRAENALNLKDLETHLIEQTDVPAKFQITLYINVNKEYIDFEVVYQVDLFSAARITSMLEQYQFLLEQISSSPNTALSDFSLVTANSSHLIPNPTKRIPNTSQILVQQSFLEWADSQPNNIALSLSKQQWTYRELADSSSKLAHELISIGLERGQVVGVTGAPSFGLFANIIAVLLSGGVLLTIDEQLPLKRKQTMLSASSAKFLCTVGDKLSLQKNIDDFPSLINVGISSDTAMIESHQQLLGEGDVELPKIKGNESAYIYFTSGSTGVPKGVLGCHKGLSHFINWQRKHFKINEKDRVAQLTNLSFDVFLRDLFLPLTSGATLCIPEVEKAADTIFWLNQEKISIVHTVPSILRSWLERKQDTVTLENLRYLFIAGEPLTSDIVGNWRQVYPQSGHIINLYGPTETTLAKLFYKVPKNAPIGVQAIGQPLPQTQALILNKADVLCGIGEVGQIVIRTPFRSLGYIKAQEQTNSSFRINPFSQEEKDIVYYTGDIGRYSLDGLVEILGRIDNQIKIRGVRVEPEEIAAVLDTYDAINSSVVIGVKEAQQNYLVAYVVPKETSTIAISDVRNYLSQQLPPAMIPGQFVFLDKMPLKANGKIDRNALPPPDKAHAELEQSYVAPRSPNEDRLAYIWQEILKVDRVGIHDDFFELGGHSLLAMQLIMRINQQFQIDLPLHLVFDAPAIAEFSVQLEIELKQTTTTLVEEIQIVPRDQPIKASFAQQRLWFLDRLMGASGLYNIPWTIRLNGTLNIPALQQSFDAVIARHESLRTCFSEQDGEPLQIIEDTIVFQYELIDLSTLLPESQNSESQRILQVEANRAFDLKKAPLIHAVLLKLSEQENILSVTLHHIVSDGWSMDVFKQELASYYRAFSQGQSAVLPELAIQYADYASWQRQWLQGKVLEKQVSYWKTQLAGLAVLELPTDHPRPKQLSYRGALEPLPLSKELTQSLKALSQEHGVSLFMTLLAAFQVLMHRYSGQDDVVVGSPIAGRNREGIEHLIGFFINTLVLRSDLSGNPDFSELLKRVRKTCIDAYAHQEALFEELVAELQPERDMSRHPLFQVMLILQPASGPAIQLPGLEISEIARTNDTAKFDLTLSFQEYEDGLRGVIEYSTDLFDAATMAHLAGHFQTLLEGIVARPESPIAELPLLTAPEQHQLLVEWNNTATDYPKEQTLVTLFEQQVEKTPEAIAVVFEGQQLSYHQLNDKVNKLAHYLNSLKDQTGKDLIINNPLIAIAVDRSLEMAIGLLAILKAGGAYVPIDPDYPIDRIHHMLDDSASPLILTQSNLQTHLSLDALEHDCIVVCLDELDFDNESIENPKIIGKAEDLAYVIYTSGSTGKPKGVMIEHHNLSNFLQDMQQRIGISINDKLLAVTTLSFDIHALEFHLPLISGSTLYIATRATANDGLALQQQLATHQINYMQATPITWELLKHSDWQPDTRLNILCGGEALIPELANYLSANGSCVWNVYGPTETTIWSSAYPINETLNSYPSIGKPIANTRIYILNGQHQLQPANIPGELCIAGEGLARGYLNRSELTTEKFIDIEICGKTERIYKTGDLARWLPDGNLECLGRIDHQIKLRGFRIELGEIESVLGQYTGVNGVVVIAREDQPGDKRLVAYLTCLKDERLKVNELRLFLKEKLPDYMVPSAFVLIDQFPQTPNGKIDRNALPAPDNIRIESEQLYVAPRSANEERLAFIWQEVLKIDQIGIHEDFFELGGHSLLVVRLLAQIEKAFDKKFSLVAIFQAPTIAQFSDLLSSEVNSDYSDSPVHLGKLEPSKNNKTKSPLFCIYGVFLYQDLAKHLVDDVSVYGVFIEEELDLINSRKIKDSVSLNVAEISKRYIKKIRSVQEKGPYNIAGSSFGGVVAFEIAQQLIEEGESVNILALFDTLAPNGFKWSLPKYLTHHFKQIRKHGISYLGEKLHEKLSKHTVDSADPLDGDIRGMARHTALRSFSARHYPGKISLFKVKDEKRFSAYKVDSLYGWGEFAEGGVDVVEISSHHIGILKDPYVKDIADYIRKRI